MALIYRSKLKCVIQTEVSQTQLIGLMMAYVLESINYSLCIIMHLVNFIYFDLRFDDKQAGLYVVWVARYVST